MGQGPERDRLIQKVKDLHLEENVELLPAVKRDAVPELLAQFDALYVGLQRQPLFRFGVSPNKLMDYMMAGKPVIFAIDAGNDMVADASCGISIEPENSSLRRRRRTSSRRWGRGAKRTFWNTTNTVFWQNNFWTSSLCQRGRSEFYPKQAGLSGFLPAVLSLQAFVQGTIRRSRYNGS